MSDPPDPTVVLVEGRSDRAALLELAARRGCDLGRLGVTVESQEGVTNFGHALRRHRGGGVRLAGLCDVGEVRFVRGALEREGILPAGRPGGQGHDDLAAVGFFVCAADLEDELIRAVGMAGVEQVLADNGHLRAFRTFRNQPFQRDRPESVRLHRFLGTTSGRKEQYGRLLAAAVPLDRVPVPLARLLDHVSGTAGSG